MSFIKSLFPLMLFTVIQSCKPYQFQNSHNYSYYLIENKNLKQVIRNSTLNLNPMHHPKYLLGRMIKPSYKYDFFYTNKILELVQKNDTMKLFCFCGPENYYFKNFNFKKGKYFIDMQSDTTRSDLYKPPIRYGNKLNVPKKI